MISRINERLTILILTKGHIIHLFLQVLSLIGNKERRIFTKSSWSIEDPCFANSWGPIV